MTVFRKFSWHSASISLPMESPIGDAQVDLVTAEFEEIKNSTSNKSRLFFFKYFETIVTDGQGSFVFIFDSDVLDLSSTEQELIKSTLNEIFWETKWTEQWYFWHSLVEGDIELVDKEDFIECGYFNDFIDAQIATGYDVDVDELYELFSEHMSKSEIDKKLTFRIISDPEKFRKS